MADQAALESAVQRARQLAAKFSQNVPVKRTASEVDDHNIGTLKVTLAYEKPKDRDNNNKICKEPTPKPVTTVSSSSSSSSSSSGNIKNYSTNTTTNTTPPVTAAQSVPHSSDDRIEIIIPHAVIGLVIGKGGENIKRIQNETGANVRVDPCTVDEKGNKVCTITGTKRAVQDAHDQVASVIENAGTGKRPRLQIADGSDAYRMIIPASRTGAIIGKGGETIKSIKQQSGCDIELDKGAKECGPDESVFIIRGSQDKIMKARSLIEARLASRGRDGDGYGRSRESSSKSGVATGANAAPVAPYTDLPASHQAAGQQSSADLSAAWAAYVAQYTNLFSQPGANPYAGQSHLGAPAPQQVPQLDPQQQVQPQSQQRPQQPQQPQQPSHQNPPANSQTQRADFSNEWIQFYLLHGRPDYAEQVIEMKKQEAKDRQ